MATASKDEVGHAYKWQERWTLIKDHKKCASISA